MTRDDAKNRRIVKLPDGRVARLIWFRPGGRRAQVQLPSGAYVTFLVERLRLGDDVDEQAFELEREARRSA